MKSDHQKRVEEFMKLAGQELPSSPSLPDEKTRLLRGKLILEEALETIEALGFYVEFEGKRLPIKNWNLLPHGKAPSLVEIADGCADLMVVTTGTLSACGIADQPLQEEVDQNNLAKFDEGGYEREDGKWVKPPHHKPPKIEEVLKKQGYIGNPKEVGKE